MKELLTFAPSKFLLKTMLLAFALLGLTACASIPTVEYQYAPSIGLVSVSVVQSLACNTDGTRLVINNAAPTITPSYQADTSQAPWSVTIDDGARNKLVDANFTFQRWDDGRLKSINNVSAGQGEAIVKTLVSIATALAPMADAAPNETKGKLKLVCDEIARLNKDSVVAITYSGQYFLKDVTAAGIALDASVGNRDLYNDLIRYWRIGPLGLKLKYPSPPYDTKPAVTSFASDEANDYFALKLQKISLGELTVLDQNGKPLASTSILVPSTDATDAWPLPIPKAKTFGGTTFAVSVAESGAVTSVQYANTSGAPGLLNGLSAVATAATPQTTADKLAELKAQNDLIVENNRHTACLADPNNCK